MFRMFLPGLFASPWRREGAAALLLGLSLASSASGQSKDNDRSTSSTCLPDRLLKDAELVLLSMNGSNDILTPYVLPYTKTVASVVGVAGQLTKPTVLLLSAYRPTIWDLSDVKGPVRAVYVSSFLGNAVAGVPAKIPVVFRRSVNISGPNPEVADSPCPELRYPSRRPEAMSAAIRIRRAFGKWPSAFHGSHEPFSFRLGGGPVPAHPSVPRLDQIRAEGQVTIGDAKQRRFFDLFSAPLSEEQRLASEEQRRRQLQGRRLLHLRWSPNGKTTVAEKEDFGQDISRAESSSE